MPLINLYSDQVLTIDEKRVFAREIHDATQRALEAARAPERARRLTIRFHVDRLEDVAVDGVLLCDGGTYSYRLEYSTFDLTIPQRVALAVELTDTLRRLLKLPDDRKSLSRITIRFLPYDAEDLSIGKRFVHADHLVDALKT